MLTASGIARSYGPRDLFKDVTLQLSAGRRIALVGGNGTGKTSLIEILVGDAEPDAGSITRPRDMTLGYLPQDLVDTATGSVIEEVLAGAGDMAALKANIAKYKKGMKGLSDIEINDLDWIESGKKVKAVTIVIYETSV